MNISQAAKIAGLSPKQVRDYEKLGLISPSNRTESNYRTYTDKDVERLNFIRHAREVGFSLAQIGELLNFRDAPQCSCSEVNAFLSEHIAELSAKIVSLESMRDKLIEIQRNEAKGGQSKCMIQTGFA